MSASILHILIVPDTFKGTLTARQAAQAIAAGREALPLPRANAHWHSPLRALQHLAQTVAAGLD